MDEISEKNQETDSLKQVVDGRRDVIRALVICLAIVVSVRSFLYEPFKIPSSSMVPTLRVGDRIFVSKFSYGLTLPLTKRSLIRWSNPKAGDVIVFLFPRDESLYYVKRVVAVPGDKIEVKGKEIIVNGLPFTQEKVVDPAELSRFGIGSEVSGDLYKETVQGRTHYTLFRNTGVSDFLRGGEAETVPPDKYFVMGDNRDESYDSRRWGYVPIENIRGKAQLIWASLEPGTGIAGFGRMRWSRVFTLIR